jgi:TrmH family RNA methyltransferase
VLSRNKIKYLASLKIKKFRVLSKQFIVEGDKIVRDTMKNGKVSVAQVIASGDWLKKYGDLLAAHVKEIVEASPDDMSRITTLETTPPVIAVLDIQEVVPDYDEVAGTLSVALDNIQDPGNMGTIIRTADWFGIQHVFCSEGCADIYNPKVVQSSMGAILNVKVHYTDLRALLDQFTQIPGFNIMGTFLQGTSVFRIKPVKSGIIIFGNESRGISTDLMPFIGQQITIPSGMAGRSHVESLNVASSVAIVCAFMNRT